MIELTLDEAPFAAGRPSQDEPASHKKHANDLMRDGLRGLDPDEPIPFFCECNRNDCFTTVWLSGAAYDRARANSATPLQAHADLISLEAPS